MLYSTVGSMYLFGATHATLSSYIAKVGFSAVYSSSRALRCYATTRSMSSSCADFFRSMCPGIGIVAISEISFRCISLITFSSRLHVLFKFMNVLCAFMLLYKLFNSAYESFQNECNLAYVRIRNIFSIISLWFVALSCITPSYTNNIGLCWIYALFMTVKCYFATKNMSVSCKEVCYFLIDGICLVSVSPFVPVLSYMIFVILLSLDNLVGLYCELQANEDRSIYNNIDLGFTITFGMLVVFANIFSSCKLANLAMITDMLSIVVYIVRLLIEWKDHYRSDLVAFYEAQNNAVNRWMAVVDAEPHRIRNIG